MTRHARILLDHLATWIAAATVVFPHWADFLEVIERVIDAAEVALADEYEPPPVIVDTREQRPFAPYLWQRGKRVFLPPERMCLEEGDYTTPSLISHVRIERKSIADLYGSLFGTSCDAMGESAPNQERLRDEFSRLQKYPRAYFVIECSVREFVDYIVEQRRRVDPVAAVQLVESMGFDYGINVQWRGSRENAEWFVGYILSRGHAQATNVTEAKKSRKRGLSLPWAKPDA
jgi:ERCC4-type nuclease